MQEIIKELLNEYYDIFPNDELFPEWEEATSDEKIRMLTEALKDKKDISQTQIFKDKYMERVM